MYSERVIIEKNDPLIEEWGMKIGGEPFSVEEICCLITYNSFGIQTICGRCISGQPSLCCMLQILTGYKLSHCGFVHLFANPQLNRRTVVWFHSQR